MSCYVSQSFTVCWWHSADCFESVHLWFTLNGLSLNPDNSEVIVIGTGVHIQPWESVHSLGVVIDNSLSFDAHVNSVCKAVNYHIKALRHNWKRVTIDVALTIVSIMVCARLDYCNAMERVNLTFKNYNALRTLIAHIVTCNWHEAIRTHHTCTRSAPLA